LLANFWDFYQNLVEDDFKKAYNLPKYFEGMVNLHGPERVIVFGNCDIAKKWLGIEVLKEYN